MSATKLHPPEKPVDEGWSSEDCKRRILDEVIKRYPCRQQFSRVEVTPLYDTELQKFYRVTLWVNDWSTNSLGPVKVIWKTFSVVLEGIEQTTVHIDEDKQKKLKIGENGRKLMEELRVTGEKV